jgi:hypothetical protein
MENLIRHATNDPQEELFERFCIEAETLIAAAKTESEALRIKEDFCKRFENECGSSLVIAMTRTFADRIIDQKWGSGRGDRDK